jgi:CRP-like cAMP-binding protein
MDSLSQDVCPDCPARYNRDLGRLLEGEGDRCTFRCFHVQARQPIPPRWFGTYGLALVRRGVIVRQRVDADGSATAIDAIGAGCAIPLSEGGDSSHAGYAADDTLLCLYPRPRMRKAVHEGTSTAAQVVSLYAASLDRVERIAQARSRPTALGRVAALLCALADTLSPPRRLACVPAAQTFTHQGAVSRTEDGIRLLDRARLEAAQSR